MGLNKQSLEKRRLRKTEEQNKTLEKKSEIKTLVVTEKPPLDKVDAEIRQTKKEVKEKPERTTNPQIIVLNDFFHYGVVPLERYRALKEILLKTDDEAEIERCMKEIRSYL